MPPLPKHIIQMQGLKARTSTLKDALLLGVVTGGVEKAVAGYNAAPSAGSTLWDVDQAYTYLAADTDLYLTSDNPADVDIPVLVEGLDDNFNPIQSLTQLSPLVVAPPSDATTPALVIDNDYVGAPPVPAKQFYRVTRMSIPSGPLPAGNVYLAESDTYAVPGIPDTASKIKAKLNIGDASTRMAMYTVPAGKTGLLLAFSAVTTGIAANTTVSLRYRQSALGAFVVDHTLPLSGLFFSSDPMFAGLRLQAGADVEVRVEANGGSPVWGNVKVVEFEEGLI